MPVLKSMERVVRKDPARATNWHIHIFQLTAAALCMALLVTLTTPWDEVRKNRHPRAFWRRWASRLVYALTVINPCFSVASDNYTFLRDASSSLIRARKHDSSSEAEEKLRRLVLGIGAFRPRRVFAVGATLRGLQLHTPLRRLFDPPVYFGTAVNLLALADGVAWPASLTLGYAATELFWTWGDPAFREPDDDAIVSTAPPTTEAQPSPLTTASDAREPPTRRHGGVGVQLYLPTVPLSAMLFGFLAFAGRWREVLLFGLCASTWSGFSGFSGH